MKHFDEKTKNSVKNLIIVSSTICTFIITGLLGWASRSILNNTSRIYKSENKIQLLEKKQTDFSEELKEIETKVPLETYMKDLDYERERKELERRILDKRLLLLQQEVQRKLK